MQNLTTGLNRKIKMQLWLFFLIYICLSATGLLLIKIGSNNTGLNLSGGILDIQLSFTLIIGIAIYVISFILSLYIISKMNISVFYPISTGSILIINSLCAYFFLKEKISLQEIFGMVLILTGIIVLYIKK